MDGCVLCSITALRDSGKGRKWEWREGGWQTGVGVEVGSDKVFSLGWALKSFRERVVKMGMCCPSLVSQFV